MIRSATSGLPVAAILLMWSFGTLASEDTKPADSNEAVVQHAFQAWADGTGSPFGLLAEDVEWTIIGSSKIAGTYELESFNALVEPFNARIERPLRPTEWQLFAKGDQVVIHFLAETPLKTGELYQNEYAWIFEFQDGEVIAARAFLDLPKFERALAGEPL